MTTETNTETNTVPAVFAAEREHYLALAERYGMTDDIRENLRFVAVCERRWRIEHAGRA